MKLNYEIWLPKLQFILQTISLNYPENPNEITIKKYYNFIQNLPVFFPEEPMGNYAAKLLDEFPVTPYLNSKSSFTKWVHFFFNKINTKLGKDHTTFYKSLEDYYAMYKPKEILNRETIRNKKHFMYAGCFSIFFILAIYYYNKH